MLENENAEVMEEKNDIESDIIDSFNDDLGIPAEEKKDESLESDTPTEEVEESKEEVKEEVEENLEESKEDAVEEELTTLKHFGGDKQVTKEELVVLGQKGMDYDRVKGERNEFKTIVDKIGRLAELYKYEDNNKLIDDLFAGYDQKKADEDNVSPEAVKFNREAEEKNRLADEKLEQVNSKENEEAEYTKFLEKHGDVKAKDIKPETWLRVQEGKTLTEAYDEQLKNDSESSLKTELEEARKEIAILKTQKSNVSPDKIGNKTDSNKPDPVLAIWDEE